MKFTYNFVAQPVRIPATAFIHPKLQPQMILKIFGPLGVSSLPQIFLKTILETVSLVLLLKFLTNVIKIAKEFYFLHQKDPIEANDCILSNVASQQLA
jgi:hypothetical protein